MCGFVQLLAGLSIKRWVPLDCVSWRCNASLTNPHSVECACLRPSLLLHALRPPYGRPTLVFGRTLTRIARPETLVLICSRFGLGEPLSCESKVDSNPCRLPGNRAIMTQRVRPYISVALRLPTPRRRAAGAGRPGAERRPWLRRVGDAAGSALLRAKINFTALRGFDGSPRHRRGFDAVGHRYLFVANQILRKHPVVVDCMNLFGSACVRFGAEISPRRLRVNLHAIDATSARCTGGLQLLLQEGLRPHVPRDLLVRHRVRCDGEALHISLLLQEGRTGITRGQGGTRLRPRWRLRR